MMLKVGIMGAGEIAIKMAKTINGMKNAQVYGIASRDIDKAESFAKKYGAVKAYGSYGEMLLDQDVELVYIALPHSHHYQAARRCLKHGKHVLCEKAFTVNAMQAKELFSMAEEKKLLLTEAIWTRYMPSRQMLKDILDSKVIGKVTSLEANLGYPLKHISRMLEPELAGGALLDLGVYVLNFAAMVFGTEIDRMTSSCVKTEKGVDALNSITLCYKDGKMAVLHSNMLAALNRKGIIYGEKGYIEVTNINNIEKITVFDKDYQEIKSYLPPKQISGYEYEVEACIQAIEKGETECPEMPHKETIRNMEQMDELRAAWGYEIPGENEL